MMPESPPRSSQREPFSQVAGTLKPTTPSYLERPADGALDASLSAGRVCYVLGARELGESSLLARVGARLRSEGGAVAFVDLTSLGQNVTPGQWYVAHLSRLGRECHLEPEIDAFIDRSEA